MKVEIRRLFYLILFTNSVTAICVEKAFINVETTINIDINENCLDFIEFDRGFLTKISCQNIEPYHENCNGKVLTMRANSDETIVYCIRDQSSLSTFIEKVFLKLNILELYLEGDNLEDKQVSCSISTKIAPTFKILSSRGLFDM